MEYKEWEPIYHQILADFNFNQSDDEKAANILKDLIKAKDIINIENLSKLINNQQIYIIGAGPSLIEDINKIDFNGVMIAADGATSDLMKNDIIPDIIVTDLDGYMPDQVNANAKGAIIIIHAHGDNIDSLKRWVPEFEGTVLGTTQAKPDEDHKLYNFGGFTDGDRAIFMASHFEARLINLIAFDFKRIGVQSYKPDSKQKLRKLTWANLLIGMIKQPRIVFQPR